MKGHMVGVRRQAVENSCLSYLKNQEEREKKGREKRREKKHGLYPPQIFITNSDMTRAVHFQSVFFLDLPLKYLPQRIVSNEPSELGNVPKVKICC